jgi:hypothetical protein
MKSERLDAWTQRRNHLFRLRGASWPATREDLIDFVARTDAPLQLLEDLYALPGDGTRYDTPEMVLAPARSRQLYWHPCHPGHDHGAA